MNTIEHIKQNLLISDILPELRQKQTIKCPLPGHEDKKPSFHFYPDTNSFYCFGCRRGGSVLDLIMHSENRDFASALKRASELTGIPLKENSPEDLALAERKHNREEILGRICDIGFKNLWESEETDRIKQARTTLKRRRFSKKLLRQMRIGMIDIDTLSKLKNFSKNDLHLTGLLNEKGKPIFRGSRIFYPVIVRNRVVYGVFGQFQRDNKDDRKYVNLCSGPLGIGSKQFLYNQDAAYRQDEVFICEGIPDTLSALQLGLNACGFLGIGNLPDYELFNQTHNVYLIPHNDDDEQGYWAAVEAALEIHKQQHKGEVCLLRLPKRELHKGNRERFRQARKEANQNYGAPQPKPEDYGRFQLVNDLNDWLRLGYDEKDFKTLIHKAEPILEHYFKFLGRYEWRPQELEDRLNSYVYPLIANRESIFQQYYIDLLAKAKEKGGLGIGKTISRNKLKEIDQSVSGMNYSDQSASSRVDYLRRKSRKMNEYELNQKVTEIILEDLNQTAVLYTDRSSRKSYIFRDRILIEISCDCREFQHLIHHYKINPAEKLFKHIVNELQIYVEKSGIQTDIHIFSHYNPKIFTLYVSANPSQMYRVTENQIALVGNGEDGVLLIPEPHSLPLKIADEPEEGLYEKIMLNPVVFVQDNLSPEEKRFLLDMAIRMVFFKSIMPTRIIPALVGPKGSKKSSTWRKMMKLFFGPNADVFQLPDKEEDLIALVTNRCIVPLDQVDGHKSWLNDCLAIIATGGVHTRRELYTTLTLREAPLNAFVFLTSREPRFRRDDVSERLLLLKVERHEDEKLRSEHEVNREVNENRSKLWRALVERLQEMIRALKFAEEFNPEEFDTPFRMADFGSFILKWGKLTDRDTEVREILSKLSREQIEFTTEDDILYTLFLEWIERDGKEGMVFKGPDLYREFTEIAEEQGVKFPFSNTRSFGRNFSKLIPSLKQEFRVDVSKKGHVKEYLFYKKGTVS